MESRKYFGIKPNRIILPNGDGVSFRRSIDGVLFEGESPTPPIVVDPILDNNSWAVIAQVCDQGKAADYWSLGDTKTDLGTDGVTRTFRICDLYNAYAGRVVFEQVELEENGVSWNPTSNTDNDGAYNDYNISVMRSTRLPALLANYSSALQAVIPNTTYKVAKNGVVSPMVILDLIDKLFLPAEREIFASRLRSVQEEWNALTRFALYALPENDNTTFRQKYKPSTPTSANGYWQRSPLRTANDYACTVTFDGNSGVDSASVLYRVAPCFTFGPSGIAVTVTNSQNATSPHIYDGSSASGTDLGTLAPGETKTFHIESGYIFVGPAGGVSWLFVPGNASTLAVSAPISLTIQPYGGSND